MSPARRLRGSFALAALLLAASLAWPWYGWEGLRTPAPAVSLAALIAALLAIARPSSVLHSRCGAAFAMIAGLVGGILFAVRLLSPPANVFLDAWQSRGALALGAAGSAVIVAVGALAWSAGRAVPSEAKCDVATDGAADDAAGDASEAQLDRDRAAVVWRAVWSSRLLVWCAGVLGLLKLGVEPSIGSVPRIAAPFGHLLNVLTAPATSWDATAYLTISQYGYGHGRSFRAYFPLYPDFVRAVAFSPQANVVFGVFVSVSAFAGALYLLAKLVELESGRKTSELTVLLVAFSPMALFFSAIYTESLFLLLSVASFYCGRRNRWALAGTLGALAAATRSAGIVLLVPLLIMYWQARRDSGARGTNRDAVWLLLVPAGALSFFAFAGLNGDLLGPLHAQQAYWHWSFTPLGAWRGTLDAVRSIHQLLVGGNGHVLATPSYLAGGQLSDPLKLAAADLTDFSFLAFGVVATVGALRRLPLAYGAYALAMLALTASSYTPFEPLASFPRYLLVVFPCQMWLALWCADRPARRYPTLLISAGLMAFFAGQFAAWRWVA
ncbi:MAG: mannosyltransferase family protein [Solirubrobacteraceae bacterium]